MRLACRHYQYAGVLSIPEGTSGKWAVVHKTTPAGASLPTANMRTMMFGGHKRRSVTFKEPVRWHELHENGSRWMSDYPIEQAQHDRELAGMSGSVLVGGLGLGYAATVLAKMKKVSMVTVVELESDVVKLVWDATLRNLTKPQAKKLHVVRADLFDYLKPSSKLRNGWAFDHAFYDIWASDGEGTFFTTVIPLVEKSHGVVRNTPVCWNEDVMRGQLAQSLATGLMLVMDPRYGSGLLRQYTTFEPQSKSAVFHNWRVPFFRDVQSAGLLPDELDVAHRAAAVYAQLYGQQRWRQRWDTYFKGVVAHARRSMHEV
jgi:hypothetical protein